MRNFSKMLLVSLCITYAASAYAQKDHVKFVNTLQGTNLSFELTRGNTYPTTALPFAVHTWAPQTGWNRDGWKYQYSKDSIWGFQQAHQRSSWINDFALFFTDACNRETCIENNPEGIRVEFTW